jgi:hypothetical protein
LQRRMPGGTTASNVGMVWQVRLLLGKRSLARAGPSRFRPPLSPLRLEYPRRMPTGLQVRRPATLLGRRVFKSLRIRFQGCVAK